MTERSQGRLLESAIFLKDQRNLEFIEEYFDN